MAKKRLKIGDIVEFPTAKGLAYLQVSQNHREPPNFGWFHRVLQGFHKVRPHDIGALVQKQDVFGCFCPYLHEYETVANFKVPDFAQPFPIFKWSNHFDTPSADAYWKLWTGKESETRLMRRLPKWAINAPIEQIVDDVKLRDDLETGWTPADIVLPENIDWAQEEVDLSRYPLETEFWRVVDQYGDVLTFLKHMGV